MTKRQNLDLNKLLPSALKNETLDSLVSNLFNRFLSEEQSVRIDGRIGKPVAGDAAIAHENLDREINSLIPALSVKTGTEHDVFTFQDFVNRLESIGANVDGMAEWLAEKPYNFSVPISYDALINFSSYYWVGSQTQSGSPSWNPNLDPEYYVIQRNLVGPESNDWQEYNFWIHVDDFGLYPLIKLSEAIQATRPIIQYARDLQLNSFVDDEGNPSASGNSYVQSKTRFNQIPQFNLYRYDGTHEGSTSGIFFYQEDPDYSVDSVLRKRVKTTLDYDYIFGIGNVDAQGRLLYYKMGGELLGTWREGSTLISTSYVAKDSTGEVVPYVGLPSDDLAGVGAWQQPVRMVQNLERETRLEISYGDLIGHMRSVLKSQVGFAGSSFGANNSRLIDFDPGLGGNIREFSSNFPLFAGMMMQKDIAPSAIVDFAEQQYSLAISSVDQFIVNNIADYVSTVGAITVNTLNPFDAQIVALLESFEASRATNENLNSVFSDSTAIVKNWPATAPILGMSSKTMPTAKFDNELGLDVIVHHDGHISPVVADDIPFNVLLVKTVVERSDGAMTPGLSSANAPAIPYAKQLWLTPADGKLKVFNVTFDTEATPIGSVGATWYKRSINTLFDWDEATSEWATSSTPKSALWVDFDVASVRNSLVLLVEYKLYAGIHPNQQVKIDVYSVPDSEEEFAKFAMKYGFDRFGVDYLAGDAFTWNYKQSTIAGFTAVPARWYDIYNQYFLDVSGIATCRPNLEPWKLLGESTKPAGWDAQWASADNTRMWTTAMWDFIKAENPGIKICVDDATDELLPPFVNASMPYSVNALITGTDGVIAVPGASNQYVLGDNGPIELVWKKSLEFTYAKIRTYFEKYPLPFLDDTWGETYVSAVGMPPAPPPSTTGATGPVAPPPAAGPSSANNRVERNLVSNLPASKFLLHGERLNIINTYDDIDVAKRLGFGYVAPPPGPTPSPSPVPPPPPAPSNLAFRFRLLQSQMSHPSVFFNSGVSGSILPLSGTVDYNNVSADVTVIDDRTIAIDSLSARAVAIGTSVTNPLASYFWEVELLATLPNGVNAFVGMFPIGFTGLDINAEYGLIQPYTAPTEFIQSNGVANGQAGYIQGLPSWTTGDVIGILLTPTEIKYFINGVYAASGFPLNGGCFIAGFTTSDGSVIA